VRTRRVLGVSLLASLGLGMTALLAQAGSSWSITWTITTLQGATEVAFIFFVVVVPASLPMTILGGVLAPRALE
jgi:hypothetical protein